MSGLYLAVHNSLPNSDVYLFTDADAKDANLVFSVISIALQRKSRITLFISGNCNSFAEQKVYKKLARTTGGQLIDLSKSDIDEAIKLLRPTSVSEEYSSLQKVSLLSVEVTTNNIKTKSYNIQSDSTIAFITAVLSAGGNASIKVVPPEVNYVTSDAHQLFCEAETYEEAITLLKTLYVKTPFARRKLATRKQQAGETSYEYLQELKLLSKDCNFCQVSAAQHRDEAVRDAFITDLLSGNIRQRLLENKTLDLQTAFDQARALDMAQKTSKTYNSNPLTSAAATASPEPEEQNNVGEEM
ncbi:Hypothetical predicted protein, partial [Paramuricea clavata]